MIKTVAHFVFSTLGKGWRKNILKMSHENVQIIYSRVETLYVVKSSNDMPTVLFWSILPCISQMASDIFNPKGTRQSRRQCPVWTVKMFCLSVSPRTEGTPCRLRHEKQSTLMFLTRVFLHLNETPFILFEFNKIRKIHFRFSMALYKKPVDIFLCAGMSTEVLLYGSATCSL